MSTVKTYYHVASDSYCANDNLMCTEYLWKRGIEVVNKWTEDDADWPDTDVVCLFDNIAEAVDFQESFGGKLLKIEWQADWQRDEDHVDTPHGDLLLVRVAEGYLAVFNYIPAELITEVGVSAIANR